MDQFVVKAAQAKPREWMGVRFEVLATGSRTMVTKMLYESHNQGFLHRHPNEQSGYVISGRYRLMVDGRTLELAAGDSYSIPADTDHSIAVLDAGHVIDVFTPPREEFR
ncbi:MAG TPA: cupin domain-containing protein [Candidatus Limnocylindria bacterium]|jgi:quercetin dioxygenase-like cupin family protein|nr:cupin domain-containing protein [Candidatus Limnocylindria bacterium]